MVRKPGISMAGPKFHETFIKQTLEPASFSAWLPGFCAPVADARLLRKFITCGKSFGPPKFALISPALGHFACCHMSKFGVL